ncbi:TBC1 domain family member 15 like [Actinidia chinensis var. chinensis]|uniref:TBC1 domain family member 15 like n=1 Tax=Actinidia chinensis var. chinensis TaxID=1590841 RepID=A0A2R6PF25_ACTCC|nr:TBC1 domain family member 15 like [Actinidia chinensis var. chinensis]
MCTRFIMRNSTAVEVDSRFAIRPECQGDVPKTHFKPRARKTLSERRWKVAFSHDGHLDIAGVLRRIQKGGVHPSIKAVVWEFLLGCFDPNSTFDERNELRQRRREQYEAWKAECQKMVPIIGSGKLLTAPIITDDGQSINDPSTNSDLGDNSEALFNNDTGLDKKVIQWKLNLPQIGLDVIRTDRALIFYESDMNQAKLWNILAVYAWVDNSIGYVQGMNDICSPMVILMENEADAFWCFERAMRKLRENFRSSANSIGVQSQLSTLAGIIRAIDPKLHEHMEELDGGQYLFALRMLMVLFRRELSFVDSLYLWELMWAMEYNPNTFSRYEVSRSRSDVGTDKDVASGIDNKQLKQYGKFERKNMKIGQVDQKSALAVFLVASVLEMKNKRLLREAKGPEDVVKIVGDITASLDAKKALNDALKIQKKYLRKAKQL